MERRPGTFGLADCYAGEKRNSLEVVPVIRTGDSSFLACFSLIRLPLRGLYDTASPEFFLPEWREVGSGYKR